MASEENPLPTSLQSSAQAELLDQIDKLRSKDLSRDISLPQLIVCGDQSSGKSSVLEAISQVAFPTNDGLCTRFVTEVCLRRSSKKFASVKIQPSPSSTPEHREKLKTFDSQADLNKLPELIESAKHAMGLTGDRTFSQDVLKLEISRPDLPHLTLVDMPGLIHTANKSQTSADVQVVNALVEKYMKEPRSITLAVISAKYDVANQIVLNKAKSFDPEGSKTIGIITKPDTLHADTENEKSYVALAKNHDISLRLGWHVLRNADHPDKMDENYNRDETERSFFTDRERWNTLPRSSVGVEALRTRLSKVLFDQITNELPGLLFDIELQIKSCEETLEKLGPRRDSIKDKLRYLLNFAERFQALVRAGVGGQYNDPFFRAMSGEPNRRLRAVIRGLSQDFATVMEERGHSREICQPTAFGTRAFCQHPSPILRTEFLQEIGALLKESKGCELPGTFNPLLIFDLFVQHSQPWEQIARDHVLKCWKAVERFLSDIVGHLTQDSTGDAIVHEIVDPAMDRQHQTLKDKVGELLTPYTTDFPATLNHQFVTHMQELREKRIEEKAKDSTTEEKDMDLHAASELLDSMLAYYGVALNTFMDNIEALAVENCLMRGLDGILSPYKIADMAEKDLNKLGGEPEDSQKTRNDTTEKLNALQEGRSVCRRHIKRSLSTIPIREQTTPKKTGKQESVVSSHKNPQTPSAFGTTPYVKSPAVNSTSPFGRPGFGRPMSPAPTAAANDGGLFGQPTSAKGVFGNSATSSGQPTTSRPSGSNPGIDFGTSSSGTSAPIGSSNFYGTGSSGEFSRIASSTGKSDITTTAPATYSSKSSYEKINLPLFRSAAGEYARFQTITAQLQYRLWSQEEIRLEDYRRMYS